MINNIVKLLLLNRKDENNERIYGCERNHHQLSI